jgi:TonB family protein
VWTLLYPEANASSEPARGRPERRRWSLSLTISVVVHAVGVVFLCWQATGPIFLVRPRLLARGQGGTATPVAVVLTWPKTASSAPTLPALRSPATPARDRQKNVAQLHKRSNRLEVSKPPDIAEAGSHLGSALEGPTEGDEIKPGFAVSFVPPRVSRWELPGGKEGDVIVELTIDEQGKVVEEKLLQGLSADIDQRVIAMLRVWRFRPATRNGIAIPFRYDARFHFPS